MPDTTAQCVQNPEVQNPVCIHTQQITDSCLDKDCIDDLRVYLTQSSQTALESASSVKIRYAELLYATVDAEPLAYKAGWYAVDVTFYYRILGDAFLGGMRPQAICGLAVFTKRVVLYGGRSKAKVFSSTDLLSGAEDLLGRDRPVAVLEVLDPMVLSSRIKDHCQCRCREGEQVDAPQLITGSFEEPLVFSSEGKRLYVTIGQFSTVRLQRGTQLSVSVCEYCAPSRQCCEEECCEEDPCELFSRIEFPMQAFFPESHGCQQQTD